MTRRLRGPTGQATVELVAMLPLLAAAAIATLQLLAAGATAELAGHAAEAGAVAILEHDDPSAAARAALPGWSRDRLQLRIDGRRVHVRLRPPALLPGAADVLASTADADAGARR
jgi:hypothetical protein